MKFAIKSVAIFLLSCLVVSTLATASSAAPKRSHPLFETEDSDGALLPVGSVRELSTPDAFQSPLIRGSAEDFAFGPDGQLIWIVRQGDDTSALAWLAPSGDWRLCPSTGLQLKKLASDFKNRKLWATFDGSRSPGKEHTCLVCWEFAQLF